MEQFHQRLLDEKSQLDERLEKLSAFLASDKAATIDQRQIPLMEEQKMAMEVYSRVLKERIELLNVDN